MCWALSFSALLASGLLFCLGKRLVRKAVVPFAVLTAIGLPIVHGPQSGFIEVARAMGLPVDASSVTNPLAIPFETATVFYPSWLPGESHGILLLVAIAAATAAAGAAFLPSKEKAGAGNAPS